MEEPPTEQDATDEVAGMADSSWLNDVSSSMRAPAADVSCEALHLALSVVHIDRAWHAGAISAEASMQALHRAVGGAASRYNRSSRAIASGALSRPPRHGTVSERALEVDGQKECDPVSVMLPMA
jgi:hypothetical protein